MLVCRKSSFEEQNTENCIGNSKLTQFQLDTTAKKTVFWMKLQPKQAISKTGDFYFSWAGFEVKKIIWQPKMQKKRPVSGNMFRFISYFRKTFSAIASQCNFSWKNTRPLSESSAKFEKKIIGVSDKFSIKHVWNIILNLALFALVFRFDMTLS